MAHCITWNFWGEQNLWNESALREVDASKIAITVHILWEAHAYNPALIMNVLHNTQNSKPVLAVHILQQADAYNPALTVDYCDTQNSKKALMAYVLRESHAHDAGFVVHTLW